MKSGTITRIREAMSALQTMPMGCVGDDGPTLEEMDKYIEEHGQPWNGDGHYEPAQRAWRLLEQALEEEA